MNKSITFYAVFVSAVLSLPACSSIPLNLDIAKEKVIKYHESGEYDKEVHKAVDKAIGEFENIKPAEKDIVILDIDETSLSNYEYSKKYDFGYIPHLWNEWIEAANAPAVPAVKKLYDYLLARGFGIVFLTGRKDYQYKSTIKNLMKAGYTKFDTLIVRGPAEYKLNALAYKSDIRKKLSQKGYNIIGDVGDQDSDLEGPYHGIRVKIPNYQYLIN